MVEQHRAIRQDHGRVCAVRHPDARPHFLLRDRIDNSDGRGGAVACDKELESVPRRNDPLRAQRQRLRIAKPEWNHDTGILGRIDEIDQLLWNRRQWPGTPHGWRAGLEQVELTLQYDPAGDDDQGKDGGRQRVDDISSDGPPLGPPTGRPRHERVGLIR
jgi:hypothetical protein